MIMESQESRPGFVSKGTKARKVILIDGRVILNLRSVRLELRTQRKDPRPQLKKRGGNRKTTNNKRKALSLVGKSLNYGLR